MIKEGNKTFVIFPAGGNDRGWVKIFDSVGEIVGQSSLEPGEPRCARAPFFKHS